MIVMIFVIFRSRQKGVELSIENATIEDDGKYLCLAANTAGSATKAFQLDVLGKYNRNAVHIIKNYLLLLLLNFVHFILLELF